jgi:hypothetical protein
MFVGSSVAYYSYYYDDYYDCVVDETLEVSLGIWWCAVVAFQ